MCLQPIAHKVKRATFSKSANAQRNAKEIENHAHADKLGVTEIMALYEQYIAVPLQIEQSFHRPDECQDAQRAKERRKFRDKVERWNEPQTSDTQHQQRHLLPSRQIGIISIILGNDREYLHTPMQFHPNQRIEHAQTHKCRQEQTCSVCRRSDDTTHPQHHRCHVANRRKATTHTSCNHDGAGINDTLMVVPHNLRDDAHHQHHRRQVVHIGRYGKRQQ